MNVHAPSWDYRSNPPYLVTRQWWRTGDSTTTVAYSLLDAIIQAITWFCEDTGSSVWVLDGHGRFVFAHSALEAPAAMTFYCGTRQGYDDTMRFAAADIDLEVQTMALFAAIADAMGVKL